MARQKEKRSGDNDVRRENLIKFREDKNWTRKQLSDETKLIDVDKKGISETTIYRLEKGKYNQKIHDNWRDLLSKALKISPQCFDEPQSGADINNSTVTQNPSERSDAHVNLRPFLSPFSKQADSQYKKSAIEIMKGFHDLRNLEKLTYEELWDHTKEYLLKIKDATKECMGNELILVYSMNNDDSIKKDFFHPLSSSIIHRDPLFLNVLGNYSREPLKAYWRKEFEHLKYQIDKYREYINGSNNEHLQYQIDKYREYLNAPNEFVNIHIEIAKEYMDVSHCGLKVYVFSLAPQPLVVELGRQLSYIQKVVLHPTFSKNIFEVGWGWYRGQHYISQSESDRKLDLKIDKPKNKKSHVALNLSLSSSILDQEIERVLGSDISVWKLSLKPPDDECVQASHDLTSFRNFFRDILNDIVVRHGKRISLHVFLSVPIIIAFEIGRLWNPKTDPELILYGLSGESGDYYQIHKISKY